MIEGLLQLPVMEMRTPHKMAADEDPLRRRLWIKGKAREHALQSENNKSARATLILDLMEPFHEPTGAVYAALIASHGEDASAEQDGDAATATVCRQQAWRSAKAALQLLNRSEDFYLETGRAAAHLPTVTSYATVMDVWKALPVGGLGEDEGRRRPEALEVVRTTRQRRVEVYWLDTRAAGGRGAPDMGGISGCIVLPRGVASMTVSEVLDCAAALLRAEVPGYRLEGGDAAAIGTWHFN